MIVYNDAEHISYAVLSALCQGTAVAEVLVVDDASTDHTVQVLADLARRYPVVRVVRRAVNSGGCGTPRNDGLREATSPYVMFLDSDDELPLGAVDALLTAAVRHAVPVVAGACLRRELPEIRDTPWEHTLFQRPAVHNSPEEQPRLVHDTLCVNKLYCRGFLAEQGVSFPEGRFLYEDFVFTARLLAASPRIALVPETVYIWHVRRSAKHPSLSLARHNISNWLGRVVAHRSAVAIFEKAGQKQLAHAARVKFLEHDLQMYIRELSSHDKSHRADWWRMTRKYLAAFDETSMHAARATTRWIAQVITASEDPRDLTRLGELSSRPPRLLPPYAWADGRPVWAADLPEVALDTVESEPLHLLPISVDAEPRIGSRSAAPLRIRVHDLYGRLESAGPIDVDVELLQRTDARPELIRGVLLNAEPGPHGSSWTAEVLLGLGALAAQRKQRLAIWDVRVRVRCGDGSSVYAGVRATGPGLRRAVVLGRRVRGVMLVQPYATADGSLALRVAPGPKAAAGVVIGRLRRLIRRTRT
ncbi:glycosyltransferase family 2 protein [Streptomyces xantholiticus]